MVYLLNYQMVPEISTSVATVQKWIWEPQDLKKPLAAGWKPSDERRWHFFCFFTMVYKRVFLQSPIGQRIPLAPRYKFPNQKPGILICLLDLFLLWASWQVGLSTGDGIAYAIIYAQIMSVDHICKIWCIYLSIMINRYDIISWSYNVNPIN